MEIKKENKKIRDLSSRFQRDLRIRQPGDLLKIARWKWPPTPQKRIDRRVSRVRKLTADAFDYALQGYIEVAIDTLDDLRGVGPPIASAILMFFDPNKFTVMDINAWLSLVHLGAIDSFDFGWDGSSDYPMYLEACITVKRQFNHSLRNTDRALWTFGALKGKCPTGDVLRPVKHVLLRQAQVYRGLAPAATSISVASHYSPLWSTT